MQRYDGDADDLDEKEPDLLDGGGLDEEADDSEPTITCPYCRREIYEDAERCPHCERYISDEDLRKKKPLLIIVGTAACLYVVYRWIVG